MGVRKDINKRKGKGVLGVIGVIGSCARVGCCQIPRSPTFFVSQPWPKVLGSQPKTKDLPNNMFPKERPTNNRLLEWGVEWVGEWVVEGSGSQGELFNSPKLISG